MTSPFPGMDPYLEGPGIWPGFRHSLAEELRGRLNDHIGPKYYADVESLPGLPVPLLAPDPDAPLDLNAPIKAIYGRAGYDWRIDYEHPVPPPELRPEMATWVQEELPDVATTAG